MINNISKFTGLGKQIAINFGIAVYLAFNDKLCEEKRLKLPKQNFIIFRTFFRSY